VLRDNGFSSGFKPWMASDFFSKGLVQCPIDINLSLKLMKDCAVVEADRHITYEKTMCTRRSFQRQFLGTLSQNTR